VAIRPEPVGAPIIPLSTSKLEVIVLDDIPPRNNKRSFSISNPPRLSSIKSEPVDLDSGPLPASATKQDSHAPQANKRIKLEPGVTVEQVTDDPELVKLKEEDDRMEEELKAAQRVALLLRERNERKAKIAAMEARSSATPERGAQQ